ncbi:PREDICTED: MICOS complex subunit Mic60 [Nicrophorus vespilloides]|uniref:MICOS complex subunit MIC60 n=1 Tax=Nicrophorus vespilloides TaxID=110193 RepID=A0ABM1MRL3_NICVS|nr:PREDICTED: MICOS complex subunit Mic60 [Nicrophorus vespilloides]
MFRVVTKIPATRINSQTRIGQSRLYRTIRHYSKKGENELCPPTPPKSGGGSLYMIGALTVVTGATLGYAKYDPDFRDWLKERVPFTDDLIRFVAQEDGTWADQLSKLMSKFSAKPPLRLPAVIEEKKKDYNAPHPVFPKIAEDSKHTDSYNEIRVEQKSSPGATPFVEISGDVKRDPSKLPVDEIADLELSITSNATMAIEEYNKSIYTLRNYNSNVEVVVEESVDRIDPSVWDNLRKKSKDKDQQISDANKHANEALKSISELKKMLRRKDLNVPEVTIERTKVNMHRMEHDLHAAKAELDKEMRLSSVTDKYWHKVEQARKHFGKELEALFPTINLEQRNVTISDADMDLFVLHAMSKVLYYQKELYKLETLSDQRLQDAMDSAKNTGNFEVLTTEQICLELEKEKRKLETEYQTKCLKLRQESEHELRQKLKMQSEAFTDHLEDAIQTREMELERLLNRKFDEDLTEERCKYKMQVSAMVGRLRGMEEAMKARADADKTAHQAQVLWSACQALFRSVKAGCPGVAWMDQLRPLEAEIHAVKSAAAENDELVKVVIEGIPSEAKERGVFPEDALRERFLKVEKVARSMALLPETGGFLHMYFLSYLQSMLLLKSTNPIPQAELNDESVDFTKLGTNEILQRARYWMDRGDFAQTLRYMNLLKGAARAVAKQWMNEARILLETQQAANTLMSYAAASGLTYM